MPETVFFDNDLLQTVKSSKMRYSKYIRSQKLERALDKKKKKNGKLQWQGDILVINNKKCRLGKTCETLTKDFEKLIEKLGKRNDLAFAVIANCQKRKRN